MRILQINTFYGRTSTGRIAQGIHDACREAGMECLTAYRFPEGGKTYEDTIYTTDWLDGHVHNRLAWWSGLQGFFSPLHTALFLRKAKRFRPDVIQLHNIHGSYLCWPLLFRYLKKAGVPVVWTLHDCLSMTGRCPFFTHSACEHWKTGCHDCPQIHEFPAALADLTRFVWKRKRRWFTGVPSLTLVTPSRWLAGIVPSSYMGEYPVRVIPNGIDTEVFRPAESDVRERYGIGEKKMLLFVANVWEERKGLSAVARFAENPAWACVVVGEGAKNLPENVISIPHTDSAKALAELYSAADLFVNPTLEDNYPTVNMEALACGTPVLTYATGGSPEAPDDSCGRVVPAGDEEALLAAAEEMLALDLRENCLRRAAAFDQRACFAEYAALYREL